LFHSISAFNTAGFDLFGNFRSLTDFSQNVTVLLTIGVLIIFGSTGYLVIEDILKSRHLGRLSVDSKVVLFAALSLILLGTATYFAFEANNPATLGTLPLPYKFIGAFFQSVTTRSAGFSALDTGKMKEFSLFFTMFLMFIGGASGSTAGGIKMGTLGILVSVALSSLQGREHAEAFGREIDPQLVMKALALVFVALMLVALVTLALTVTEDFAFTKILFEAFSAVGTVGLTTGITPSFSMSGRLIIVLAMFFGRIGPLVLTSLLVHRPSSRRYPPAIIRIG
jgi:trk system potassium uptake protein TrkH